MNVERDAEAVYDPAALAEDVDLDLERRKEILHAEAVAAGGTLWQALGLPWNAPTSAVKSAYLEAAKVFHPDRYAGKRLGTYRARLERIFRRATEARDVLGEETRRAAYARTTAPATEFTKMEARKLDDERRSAERRARLARQNPLVARAARVGELVGRGKAALERGDFLAAANDLQLAQSIDPSNPELSALAAEAKRRGAAQRAADQFDKAMAAEAMGSFSAAAAGYRAALDADPRHVRAAAAGARMALKLGDLSTAREMAQAGVRAGPGLGVAHEALGMVLEAQGDKKEARRALEKALELDPKLELAKERLKKLRWGILG
ncbi:MAG TPA: tetratricopeptide repeat protein [Anaeromyxobacter sp.]|nr:tetratricopeptide repeat protein [Anaeromyxobacter sp.]